MKFINILSTYYQHELNKKILSPMIIYKYMDTELEDEDELRAASADRTIRITGEINEELAERVMVALHGIASAPGTITVIISSDGGDIEEGLRIVDGLCAAKHRGCDIHTVVSGKAYSMGAFIACVGDTRTMYPHSRIMVHPGRFEGEDGVDLTPDELKRMSDELDRYNGIFKKMLSAAGVMDSDIERLMVGDNYLTATEAISIGLVNSVETSVI